MRSIGVEQISGDPIATFAKLVELIQAQFQVLAEATEERNSAQVEAARYRAELTSMFARLMDWIESLVGDGPRRRRAMEAAEEMAAEAEEKISKALGALGKLAAKCQGCQVSRYRIAVAKLDELAVAIQGEIRKATLPLGAGWDDDRWDQWSPNAEHAGEFETVLSPHLYAGRLVESPTDMLVALAKNPTLRAAQNLKSVVVPAYLPFIGQNRTIIISFNQNTEAKATSLMHALIYRISTLLGPQVVYTLLDPHGFGQAFPMQRFLPRRGGTATPDAAQTLTQIQTDITRIYGTVLDGVPGLHLLDARRMASEKFEVIVAANFPRGYDHRSAEMLFKIANAGPPTGRYVVLHYNSEQGLPRDMSFEQIERTTFISAEQFRGGPDGYRFLPDQAPAQSRWQRILKEIEGASKVTSVDSSDLVGAPEANWWNELSNECLSAPIGVRGAADIAEVLFGQRGTAFCAHGLVAGKSGSGKSTLYHALILSLAVRYSPEELQIYLIDGKKGTEFQKYEALPHAKVVSLNSVPELSRSILKELDREVNRRAEKFNAEKLTDLKDYRAKTREKMPRILLLIDEYQELFEDDKNNEASELMKKIAEKGRSFGVHMFLGSQQVGAVGMRHRTEIFNQFNLKIALQLERSAITDAVVFEKNAQELIKSYCDEAGKFVMVAGKDQDAITGKVAQIDSEKRDSLLNMLRRRAQGKYGKPEVFRNEGQPVIWRNPFVRKPKPFGRRPAGKDLETVARLEEGFDGFGQTRWTANDNPIGAWLGRRFNVHGHAMIALKRRIGHHLTIVGNDSGGLAGMTAGFLVSLATIYRPADVSIDVVNSSNNDEDPIVHAVSAVVDHLLKPTGFTVNTDRDPSAIEAKLDEFTTELAARAAATTRDLPAKILMVIYPDQMPSILYQRSLGAKSANPWSDKFRKLMADGARHGLHLVVVSETVSQLKQVLSFRAPSDLTHFNHRVSLQISKEDSMDYLGSMDATKLQLEESKVLTALYENKEENLKVRFMPYEHRLDVSKLATLAGAVAG